jgi:hypothetical protein
MCGAIPPLPQYTFMAWCLVKHRDNFTFYNGIIHVPQHSFFHSSHSSHKYFYFVCVQIFLTLICIFALTFSPFIVEMRNLNIFVDGQGMLLAWERWEIHAKF